MVVERLTIVLPIYNGEKFLEECITSLKEQSMDKFKVIVVNDGSTDGSEKMILELIREDQRFSYKKHSLNLGLPAAINTGANSVKSKYQTWISADDVIGKNYFFEMLGEIERINCDFIYSDYFYIDDKSNIIGKSKVEEASLLHCGNVIGTSYIYTTDLYNKIGGYREETFMYEDYDFFVRAWKAGAKFHKVGIRDFYYRWHASQLTHSRRLPIEYFYFRRNLVEESLSKKEKFSGRAIVSFARTAFQRKQYRFVLRAILVYAPMHPLGVWKYLAVKLLERFSNEPRVRMLNN